MKLNYTKYSNGTSFHYFIIYLIITILSGGVHIVFGERVIFAVASWRFRGRVALSHRCGGGTMPPPVTRFFSAALFASRLCPVTEHFAAASMPHFDFLRGKAGRVVVEGVHLCN